MESIRELSKIDFYQVVIGLLVLMFAFIAIAKGVGEISNIFGKPVKWIKNKNKDHELLSQTVDALNKLQEQHNKDDNALRENIDKLTRAVDELKNTTQERLNKYSENRVHDREQSFKIQETWTNTINSMAESDKKRDKQISSLMLGTMELLGDKIDQKFSKYVELEGIPENEVSEFDSLYTAYAATGGNSTRKHKYEYVKNNLRVIPVKVDILKTVGDSNGY